MAEKNCIIIHGCPDDESDGTPNKGWLLWLKNNLISKGIKAELPSMPKPWNPIYSDYKKVFEKLNVNENTILVGHSCGCAFLVKWLGETKKKIKKLILVAPWKIPFEDEESQNEFYLYKIDKTIKERVKEVIIFTSNDEEADGKKSVKIFHKDLGGKIINLKEHGHYTEGDMGTIELPELLDEII